MGKQKHRKNDSSSELEGLRTEDGSQPSLKGKKSLSIIGNFRKQERS